MKEIYQIEAVQQGLRLGLLDLEAFSVKFSMQEKRIIEKSGAIFLLKEMLKSEHLEIRYDEFGKPYLEGRNEYISISHSHKWLAIIVDEKQETGIDIELCKEKIFRIGSKFASEDELQWAGNNAFLLTMIWAAKESIYKAYGKKSLEFKTNINIDNPGPNREGLLKGKLTKDDINQNYYLHYRAIDEYVIVFTANET